MRRGRGVGLILCVGLAASGCAHGGASGRGGGRASKSATAVDAAARLVLSADAHLATGIAESRLGHLDSARDEFNRAVDVYLTAPGGAYATTTLTAAYRRTLETVQLQELETLAAGDGFTEGQSEPAAIDEVADLRLGAAYNEEVRNIAEEALRREASDLSIELNDAVLSSIDLYQGSLHEWFESALERGAPHLPHIRKVFAEEGVPQDLAYLALVESAFRTGALSRAKAKGMFQFMPATGRRFGLEQDWWVDERSDPEKATRAAAQYLKLLYELFGDWNLAMASYNAGEGRVMRALERTGAGDFWTLREAGVLAAETRNYVPMIHAAIVVAKAADKYGFHVEPQGAIAYDTVPVKGAVDLRVIAECIGAGLDQVRSFNPELRRMATPANRTYGVKVPDGQGPVLAGCLETLPAEKRVAFRTHTVGRGQTLTQVARRYGAKASDIAAANGLGSGKRLARGTQLIIPVKPAAARRLAQTEPVPIQHRVRAGDTLTAIASRYNTTVRNLMSWNGLRGTQLATGYLLTIYTHR